jgi:hypothetical protein
MPRAAHGLALVLIGSFGLLLSGCFTCVAPFYEDNQVVQDKRVEGTHESSRNGKKDESIWTIQPSLDAMGKYDVSVRDGDVSIELIGTLFKLDGLLFLELYPIRDSGVRRADVPTASQIIRSAMYERRHVVWRIEFTGTGLNFWVPSSNGSAVARRLAPELKASQGDDNFAVLLPPSTKEAQMYLRQFATNSSVFDYKCELLKKSVR